MGKRGPRERIIPVFSSGPVADYAAPIGRDEASKIFGAELSEETWEGIYHAVAHLNFVISGLAEAPRATRNVKDRRSFETWRERTLHAIKRARNELRAIKAERLHVSAALEVAVKNHMAQPSVRSLEDEEHKAEWRKARELYHLREHLNAALTAPGNIKLVLDRADAAETALPASEANVRRGFARSLAVLLSEAGLPVELTPRAIIDGARGTLTLGELTPFERLVAALEVFPGRTPAALADAIRDALGKNCCERGEQFFPSKTVG